MGIGIYLLFPFSAQPGRQPRRQPRDRGLQRGVRGLRGGGGQAQAKLPVAHRGHRHHRGFHKIY